MSVCAAPGGSGRAVPGASRFRIRTESRWRSLSLRPLSGRLLLVALAYSRLSARRDPSNICRAFPEVVVAKSPCRSLAKSAARVCGNRKSSRKRTSSPARGSRPKRWTCPGLIHRAEPGRKRNSLKSNAWVVSPSVTNRSEWKSGRRGLERMPGGAIVRSRLNVRTSIPRGRGDTYGTLRMRCRLFTFFSRCYTRGGLYFAADACAEPSSAAERLWLRVATSAGSSSLPWSRLCEPVLPTSFSGSLRE